MVRFGVGNGGGYGCFTSGIADARGNGYSGWLIIRGLGRYTLVSRRSKGFLQAS